MSTDADTLNLYVVETIVTFRHKYIIKAKSADHAMDAVAMRDSGNESDYFDEYSQKFIGETIMDAYEIGEDEFWKMNDELIHSKDEIGSYWLGTKQIRVIDYDK